MISSLENLHYLFCSDLGNKTIKEKVWPENINFALFKVKQTMDGGGGRTIPNTEIFIPGFYEVQKVGQDFWSVLTEKEYQTFIAPSDYYENRDLFYTRKKQLFIPVPEEIWNVHPHLPYHSTFQFYFLRNSLFTANLDYLDVDDFQGNGSRQVRVDWTVRATPSGTYVIFLSNHIFFKWKIEVRQGIVNMSLIKVAIDGVSKFIGGAKQAVGKFFGIDSSGIDKAKEEIAQNLVGRDRGKDFMEREKDNRNQELQTERMFASNLQYTGDGPIEPSVFYANTVKFPYNLFDYWLRNDEEPFTCRFYYSNNLLNNLIHNNDANPITYPLDITFAKLGNIIRPGFIQGRLDLDYDPNGRMAKCFAGGVTFYKDKKKHFVNPNLGVKQRLDEVRHPDTGGNSYTAQAITEGGEGITIDIPYTADQRGYSHTTFIRLTDTSVQNSFKDAVVAGCSCSLGALHYSNSVGFCWGCTYDELKRVGFVSIKFTPATDCSVILKIDVNSEETKDLDLKAGTEYTVTISETQFIFKGGGSTRIEWQKQPTNDDFKDLDWSPPAGSGGEIEIPLEDPEIAVPEPGEGDLVPEDDFTPDPFDPSGGEPEIPPIEPDLPPDIDPGLEPDFVPDIDPPPVEPDIPEIDPNDPDAGRDPEHPPDTGYDVPPPDMGDDDDAD